MVGRDCLRRVGIKVVVVGALKKLAGVRGGRRRQRRFVVVGEEAMVVVVREQ